MSRRFVSAFAGLLLMAVLILGVVGGLGLPRIATVASAQPATSTPTPARARMHPLPPELAFLRGMNADQRFDHLVGAQVTYRNPQGQNVVLNAIPGKVTSVSTNAVTITPNTTTQSRSFAVTSNTWVVARPHQGSVSAFRNGDRVVVYVVGNSNDAAAIVEPHDMMSSMARMTGNTSQGAVTP